MSRQRSNSSSTVWSIDKRTVEKLKQSAKRMDLQEAFIGDPPPSRRS
ncbi:MAG: hypothetical protein JZD41_03805 [Thermoproteus sp.]|nr:hypothetical protein [Thermoproteus sp.]